MSKKNSYWFINERGIKQEYCYFILFNKWLKIGYTTDLISRYNSIRFSLPEECELLGYFKSVFSASIENYFINNLTDYKSTRGEWIVYDSVLFQECIEIISSRYKIKIITNE